MILYMVSHQQWINIGSGNGLGQMMLQAVIWYNGSLIHWYLNASGLHDYALMWLDECSYISYIFLVMFM